MPLIRIVLTISVLAAFAASAAADRIVLHNGQVLDGQIIGDDSVAVTVQIDSGGSTLTRRIDRRQIQSLVRTARVDATFVTLPVVGRIGDDVTAAALRAGFAEARRLRPRYVVLAIDSPGGSVVEMFEIIQVIADASKDVEVVAFVKEAHSAAAVIAMTCRTIYLASGATIGATVPFQVNETGIADVDAKFRSIFRAQTRAAAAFGRHADLLIRGMQEVDLEIYLADVDGQRVLRPSGPGKVLKAKGEILTLTADEAGECGLAYAANTLAELGKHLTGGGPWHEGSRRAWQVVAGYGARERWQEQLELERRQRQIARHAAIKRVEPEWEALDRRMAQLAAKNAAVENAVADLNRKFGWEFDQIAAEYQQALAVAQYQIDPSAAATRALEVRNAREASARQYLQANVAHLRADGDAALLEARQLQARQRQLLSSIPEE